MFDYFMISTDIRHIQHHGAQLIDRVRSAADIGVRWVAAR
jgi:hypothetical protein